MSVTRSTSNRLALPPVTVSTKVSNGSATRCARQATTKPTSPHQSFAKAWIARGPRRLTSCDLSCTNHNLTNAYMTFVDKRRGEGTEQESGLESSHKQRCTLALQRLGWNERDDSIRRLLQHITGRCLSFLTHVAL